MLKSLIYNGLSPTVSALSALPHNRIFLSASTISNKKSPVLRLIFSVWLPVWLPVWFLAWHSAWFPARNPGPFVGDNVLVLSNLSICLWEIFPIDKYLNH